MQMCQSLKDRLGDLMVISSLLHLNLLTCCFYLLLCYFCYLIILSTLDVNLLTGHNEYCCVFQLRKHLNARCLLFTENMNITFPLTFIKF